MNITQTNVKLTTKKRRLPKTAKELQVQVALGTLEIATILSILRSKKTPGDTIEVLNDVVAHTTADDTWDHVLARELICKHLNTPASTLTSIFHRSKFMEDPERVPTVEAYILSHPTFPVKLLHEVFHKLMQSPQFDADYSYLFQAIENPNTPVEFLERLAKHENVAVRTAVAEHSSTPPEVLEYLSTAVAQSNQQWRSRWNPRESVASNPHTPPHVLETMSTKSNSSLIRKRVAANLSTPVSALKLTATDDRSFGIRATALHTLFKLGEVVFKSA